MEMSRNLFNAGLEPLTVTPASKRCAAVAHLPIPSSDKAVLSWMACEVVQAFIYSIPDITTADEAHDLYVTHLQNSGSFEGLVRAVRLATALLKKNGINPNDEKTNEKVRKKIAPPAWYKAYLRTKHWAAIRVKALDYYDSCVLCGLRDDTMETHHRHYTTIGRESIQHVSVLCGAHHEQIHPMLGIRTPRTMPIGAKTILTSEGLTW